MRDKCCRDCSYVYSSIFAHCPDCGCDKTYKTNSRFHGVYQDAIETKPAPKTKFAWRRLPLYELVNHVWVFTGQYAWLKKVRVITNVFGDVLYVSLKEPNNE